MLNYYVVYIVCCPLSCKINWAERSITQTEAEISTHRAQTPAILSRYAGLRQITAKHSKIHMKIEVNSSMKVVRRSIENNLPTSTTDRSFLRSNRCESKGETRLYLGRVDEEAKGIGSPPALCFRRAPVTRARERDGTNGRAAAKAGGSGSLFIRARLVGLVCRRCGRGLLAPVGSRHVTARRDGSARDRRRRGDRASQ